MADNLIYSLVELGTVAVEVVLILLYCNRLNVKSTVSPGITAACYALFLAPLAVMSLCSAMPVWRIGYSFVGLALLYRFCYDIDWPNSIYLTAVFLILSLASDILCSYVFNVIGIENNGLSGNALERIAYNGIAKLLHLILIQTIPFLIRRKQSRISFVGIIPLLTAQLASLMICLCLYFTGIHTGRLPLGTIVGVVATLYVNIVICFYVEAISAKNDLDREKELMERKYQNDLKYYESIKKSQEETRSLWHEIRKYLNTIHALVDSGQNSAAVQCMDEVEQHFGELTINVDVGNSIINSILSVGLHQAQENHIPFYIDAWVSANLGVLPQDLFIILGNAIDNAIEECRQMSVEQKPYIQVSIHQKGKMLAIKIENPCRPQSMPKPGKIHGYGLKNVQRCAEKYNGELQTIIQDNVFHFFVLLNMN